MDDAFDAVPLVLKPREDRRLRAGHLWVFSNEVDTDRTPLSDFFAGQPVAVLDHREHLIGTGYVNPHTLICARLLSRSPKHPWGPSLLVHRLKVALSLRELLFDRPYYRLVHGEGDLLPGLVVDRYGDYLGVQLTTAGMDYAREAVISALERVLRPRGMILRNDVAVRGLEGLEQGVERIGEIGPRVSIEENGVRFEADPEGGQKTGWFFDQRENRQRVARLVRGRRVLDLFTYGGGFGVTAAAGGAEAVVCVDSAVDTAERVATNAALNGVADRVQAVRADVFDFLKAQRDQGGHFDLVIVDPPAFIKRRKDFKAGLEGYRRLNQLAIQAVAKDGLLVSCSCSQPLERATLVEQVLGAARHLDRNLQLFAVGEQAADHPRHPAIPETEYLKCLFMRVLRS